MGVYTLEYASASVLDRFYSKIKVVGECWKWIAAKNGSGYGHFGIKTKVILAHRFSYELFVKDIPKELQLDHLCRNRWCVNPLHLEAVTPSVNSLRGDTGKNNLNSKKTHCSKGHPFEGLNLVFVVSENRRRCRICLNEKSRNYYKKYHMKKGVN